MHFSTTCDSLLGFLFCSVHIYTCCDAVLISPGRCLPLAVKHGSCIVVLMLLVQDLGLLQWACVLHTCMCYTCYSNLYNPQRWNLSARNERRLKTECNAMVFELYMVR
ncbi:hypothetical protein EDB19DRAFT_316745 [Suillus lakei]|nr:hypothetical protein EDB19DRAFT_316745 [Suillus lakei]